MSKRKKAAEKKVFSISPQVENLLKETKDHMEFWAKDRELLLSRLQLLSVEQQQAFFLNLYKQENDNLLPLLEALCGKEETVDLVLASTLGHWVSPQAAALLHRMAAATPSKTVAKSIRKSIFRLKSIGLAVEEVGGTSPAVFQPPRLGPAEGFLSPIDPSGNRFVLLFQPQIPQGLAVMNTLISDSEGIVNFNAFETSRKNSHEYLTAFQMEYPFKLVEADPAYCLGLIMESYEIGQRKGKPPSADFLKWRPLMGTPAPLPLKPLIYQYIKEEEVKSRIDLLDRSGSLFQIASFQNWTLSEEEAQKYLILVKEASASRLILSPYQKESRVEDIYRQAVQEVFDESRRLLYRRRLEEMAYCLLQEEKEPEAQISLAAAVGLEKESGLLTPHPFLLELVKRSLGFLIEKEEEERKRQESSLIVKP
ncbi:MAG: hypothetical protein OEW45_11865 [Deltaproteobacteria bacterium]|nr:hypothetical protein [Deltaproteobacteria bacterium]